MERGRLQKVPLNWTCVLEILFITDLSGAGDAGWDQSYKTFFGRIFFGQSYKGFFINSTVETEQKFTVIATLQLQITSVEL